MTDVVASKDPENKEPYFFVFCSDNGLNDGSVNDNGDLQGAIITSYTLTVQSGLTKITDSKAAVTIDGVSYSANTVITIWVSGGELDTDYHVTCHIVTDNPDGVGGYMELEKTMVIPVRAN